MRKAVSTFLFMLFVASALSAATFDRVTDRDLLDHADLVVVANVVDSTSREAAGRDIFTDSRLKVEEVLKGSISGDTIVVSQLGGFANGHGIAIPGSATYTPGQRVLAFLRRMPDGTYVTAFMGLGRFRFATQLNGREVLLRDSDGIEIDADDAFDPKPAVEFVNAIRAGKPESLPKIRIQSDSVPEKVATNSQASDFCTIGGGLPLRWKPCNPGCTIGFTVNQVQPGVNTTNGLNAAFNAWNNDPNSFLNLEANGIGNDTGRTNDGQNDIVFNWDGSNAHPSCESSKGCGILYFNGGSQTHTFDGSTFNDIESADVIVHQSVTNQTVFEAVLAHELGHGIGFRHSNETGRTPFTTTALMTSTVPNNGATLKDYDKEAAAEVYGNGYPCQNVQITGQTGSSTVNSGSTKTLTVSASGTTPYTYQWYEGGVGDTTTLVGTNSSFTTPPITTQKQYWVRVSNSCPSSANSTTITLTPQAACNQPNIVTQPQNAQVTSGGTATLTVGATGDQPLTYKWYRGAVGDTSTQVGTNSSSFTTPPLTESTSYWVQVSNTCGSKNSSLATVTVTAQCTGATIATQPQNATVALGSSAALSVVAAGTSPFTYQWYQGDSGNQTLPIAGATSDSYAPGPFNTSGTFKYWVKVSNNCGTANSNTVTVTAGGCVGVTVVNQPTNVSVGIGAGATLNVTLGGNPATSVQWYQGDSGNESQPIPGATTTTLAIGPFNDAGTHKYWVKATNECGTVNSLTIIVTVACAEASTPEIGAPATTHFSVSYDVSWDGDLGRTPTFELQEATNLAFTANLKTFVVTGAKKKTIPAHLEIATDTRFYYRVRAINACTQVPTSYSVPTSVVVTRPLAETSTSFALSIPDGTSQPVLQDLLVPGFGDTATNGDTFAITIDVPWITVFPSTGALSGGGTTVQLTINPTPLDIGTTTATVVITRTQPSAGRVSTNGTTAISLPFSVSKVTPVTPSPRDGSAPPGTMIIPAVAHADGIGTRFQSDMRIVNTSDAAIEYEISFTPSGQNGAQVGKQTTLRVDANDVMSFDDVVKAWFGAGVLSEFGVGTIEIRPMNGANPLATFASSRTYAVEQRGTYGQFIPAILLDNFIGDVAANSLARISLQQVANSAAFRTNIGIVEGSGSGGTALLKLFDGNNNLLQSTERPMQPFGHEQVAFSQVFGNVPVTDGRIEVAVTSANGKATAYASVIDNATSDPLLVFPEQALRSVAKHYVVPGVAELDNGVSSNFHSDMRVYNAGNQPVSITLNYFPQAGDSTPRPTSVTRVIEPGKVTPIDNVLPSLWNLSRTGGAVTIDAATDASLVVTARTFSRDEKNGTYGQFIPGVTSKNAVGSGERALEVLQLEQSEQYRTNLGLVEVTGQNARVEITAYKPDTKISAVTAYDMKPNEFIQFGRIFQSLGLPVVYGGRVSVKVLEGTGRVAAYGSVVDNRTVDPTYVPAQ